MRSKMNFLLGTFFSYAFLMGVSASLQNNLATAADPMYGLFMIVKGDIKVKNLKSETSPAKVGTKIFPGETVISGVDSRSKIRMSDGNTISVSPSSELKIDKYESAGAEGPRNVELNLVDGKVRSKVEQKYDGDKSKFLMKTPTAVAGVRGTDFVTSYSKLTQLTKVVTLHGTVTLSPPNTSGPRNPSSVIVVQKGESSSVAAGAAAPEAPKKVPKEELKRMDQDSSAQGPPAPPKDSSVASDKKSKDSKDSKDAKDSKDVKDSKNTKGKDDGKTPKEAQGDNKGDSSRNPASTEKDSSGKEPSDKKPAKSPPPMIDKGDMDAGSMIRDNIRGPSAITPGPSQMLPPPPPKALIPPPNPIVGDIIRDKFNKSRAIIRPVPK